MSEAALTHDGKGGIWHRYLAGRAINAAPWHDAIARDQLVGTCKPCGGYLRPGKPYRIGLVDWFPATCVSCRNEIAAAGPRPKEKPAPRGRP